MPYALAIPTQDVHNKYTNHFVRTAPFFYQK